MLRVRHHGRVTDTCPDLLAESNPIPSTIDSRLREQLHFIIEVDRLKTVLRQSPLAAARRRENDAEHSWHLALMVLLLAEHSDEPIDVGHTIKLVICHDLVEIYAGDTPLHDPAAGTDQQEREEAAAECLFGQLPPGQATELRALWDEFEARRTSEARFAKAMDRLQPLLLNWMAKGGTWQAPGNTAEGVRTRTSGIADASATLWDAGKSLIDEGERRSWARTSARD